MYHLTTVLLLFLDRYAKKLARIDTPVNANIPGVEWLSLENHGLCAGALKDKPRLATGIHASGMFFLGTLLIPGWAAKNNMEKLGASLLLAGGGSNLWDRLRRGSVTDMFRFSKAPGHLKQLVVNIADFMLILGALFTVIGHIHRKK